MSQSGQQHPKADVGGQRSEAKKPGETKADTSPSARDTIAAGKKPAAKSDAKK